jgi:uncharacterized protein (DUF1778 family)
MPTAALNARPARMEFKTTMDMKALLGQAAAMDGLDLTAFVLGSAIEKAHKVLNEHASITLSQQGQAALVQMLQTPTQAMKDVMALPDLPVRRPARSAAGKA